MTPAENALVLDTLSRRERQRSRLLAARSRSRLRRDTALRPLADVLCDRRRRQLARLRVSWEPLAEPNVAPQQATQRRQGRAW